MAYVTTSSGAFYMINNLEELSSLIYEQLGYEVGDLFRQYAHECSREYLKANSDLDSYEASLESNARAFSDLLDQLNYMNNYLDNAQRLNRQDLREMCSRMDTIINNQI